MAPQPFLVLVRLLENAGTLVTREELREQLWGTSTAIEFDTGINRCVRQIRTAILDNAETPRYIQTVRQKGYRFIAPVERSGNGLVSNASAPLSDAVEKPSSQPGPAPEQPPSPFVRMRLPRWTWGAAGIGVTLVLIFLLQRLVFSARQQGTRRQNNADPIPLVSFLGEVLSPSFSPDGASVVFTWNGGAGNVFDLYRKDIGSGTVTRITNDGQIDYSPVFSPDGKWIAFCRGTRSQPGALLLIPTSGGAERRLAQIYSLAAPNVRALSWSPDGNWLVSSAVLNPDNLSGLSGFHLQSRKIVSLTRPIGGNVDVSPAISPDGRLMAFARDVGRGISTIDVVPFNPGMGVPSSVHPILPTEFSRFYNGNPAWSPDGSSLVFDSYFRGRLRLWGVKYKPSSYPHPLENLSDNSSSPSFSLKGAIAFVRSTLEINIWRLPLDEHRLQVVGEPVLAVGSTSLQMSPQVSPDCQELTFASDRSGYMEIWRSRTDGSVARQLTHLANPGTGSPAWSPDGLWITFDSRVSGFPEIYVVPSGGGTAVAITHDGSNTVPVWSPDGRWIYFTSNRTGTRQIWRTTPTGSFAEQVTRQGGFGGQLSPDGRFLFFTKDNTAVSQLCRRDLISNTERMIAPSVSARTFAPAANGVYFLAPAPAGGFDIQFTNDVTSVARVLRHIPKEVRWGVSLSRNERSFFYGQVDRESHDLALLP